ncbi:polysaccharide biosynthesis protein [Bacillus sp. FJAT-45350]|uniref:polysaccharide biosynthesis protein n=1 Tax=Bacillus sp. FJAT-45350 TaxID=2011014 RepID=UPI000BB8EC59|nr:nucleoside-diphosphate sugar epimerase/dehydratase [Bacillus sp. FJAT-45350]
MSYRMRLLLLVSIDSLVVLFSIYLSHFFLNPFAAHVNEMIVITSVTLLVAHHLFAFIFGFYRRAWRYASMGELLALVAVVVSSLSLTAIVQQITFDNIYLRGLSLAFMLHILLLGGIRFAWRYYQTELFHYIHKSKNQRKMKRTLIIGAGSTGRMLVRQLREHSTSTLLPVGFLDDDKQLQNLNIDGVQVKGEISDIEKVVKRLAVEHIVIAIPSLSRTRLNQIITSSKKVCKNVQILPQIEELALGNLSVNHIRDVSIDDLLGREPVELDVKGIASLISGKIVLVTGAGGSIGSEVCRQLSVFKPETLILLGHGENSIYLIEQELKQTFNEVTFLTEIADVQDREKIFSILKEYKPNFVFHAAAHKHVPLMERNPEEAVKNNIYGTKNVAEASAVARVDTFVMISTDKAVNPTSVMGATKRIAEMIVQELDEKFDTRFVAVRFGNVLGSRGSVIPLFKKQIASGGPVTVTHPDMERYFMTIPEASRLVIQAGTLARGGEVFVLDMGEPVKIVDLARNLIELSGFTKEEIKVEYTGMRPGEKLYEELLNEDEVYPEQVYPKIYIGKSLHINTEYILRQIEQNKANKVTLRDTLLRLANHKELTESNLIELVK